MTCLCILLKLFLALDSYDIEEQGGIKKFILLKGSNVLTLFFVLLVREV